MKAHIEETITSYTEDLGIEMRKQDQKLSSTNIDMRIKKTRIEINASTSI